jgi:hypothetical protein
LLAPIAITIPFPGKPRSTNFFQGGPASNFHLARVAGHPARANESDLKVNPLLGAQ